MLRSLSIRSFKGFDRLEGINLQPFTVLIGPNGAGKTSILQAIDLLGALVRSNLTDHLAEQEWDYSDLPHLRAQGSRITMSAELLLDGENIEWRVELGARRYPGIAVERVQVSREPAPSPVQPLLERHGRAMSRRDQRANQVETIEQTLTSFWLSALEPKEDRARFPTLVSVAAWARGIHGYFFLDPLKLRAPSREEGGERGSPDIGRHGELLASFLHTLRQRAPVAFERMVARVQKHYPPLRKLETARTAYGCTRLYARERWNGSEARFNAQQVSDGLLRLIAVAAMHELPSPPRVLLIDEVENGLHPHLLGGLIEMLQAFVRERKGASQVIVTTHSPITVNFCDSPESVLIVHRGKAGEDRVIPMSSVKGFDRLRRSFDNPSPHPSSTISNPPCPGSSTSWRPRSCPRPARRS
ncbi:MAG: AAA family ATPase [Planctomycetes bacterium]|nr:AAA family ATPase [Planctomycetota bacterium]